MAGSAGTGQHRNIIVIGGSAGSVQALLTIVGGLPPDFPAALLVVVHIPPRSISRLPEILTRSGPLPAVHPQHLEAIEHGRIYVAPPDRHLLVRDGHIVLARGPRENRARPAIDPLFRSAARAYGSRLIGVVLSGALYDGSIGLLQVKTRGGLTVVQDPFEAAFDSMPRNAIRHVAPDSILPVADIPAMLETAIKESVTMNDQDHSGPTVDEDQRMESVIAEDFVQQALNDRSEKLTVYTCPDCGGAIWQNGGGNELQFRCHVGHRFAPEAMLGLKSEELEDALWASLRLLKEKATLGRQIADRSLPSSAGVTRLASEQAALDERYAGLIQELLESMPQAADQQTRMATVHESAS